MGYRNWGSGKASLQRLYPEAAGFNSQGRFLAVRVPLAALLCFLFGLAGSLCAETHVSGNITSDTTWAVAGSPYIVTGDVTVYHTSRSNGEQVCRLTVEPGVEIRFEPGTGLYIG